MKVGVFDMLADEYFAAHGVSQSELKLLARSPAHLKSNRDNPPTSTQEQIIGRLTHLAVFEPELFADSHWVKPVNYTNMKGETRKWNANAKEAKDWLAAHEDRPTISNADLDVITAMKDSIFSHPAAALALKQGRAEKSIFAEDADTGVQKKARLDWISGNAIVDLKSCQDASPDGFSRIVAAYQMDVQAAYYLDMCNSVDTPVEHFLFIAIEKTAPFCCAVYELDEESIALGRSKYRRLLNRYLECVVSDSFPGYSCNVERLSLPAWSKRHEMNAQLLEDAPLMPALEVS